MDQDRRFLNPGRVCRLFCFATGKTLAWRNGTVSNMTRRRIADALVAGRNEILDIEHHAVRMQRVVGAVVQNQDRQILLLWHHRFITETWGWEIPCGIVEDGEASVDAVVREVEEETGFRPSGLGPLLTYQPCIGIADTPHELFLATGAVAIGDPTDVTEAEQIGWFSLDEVSNLISSGQIHDSPTLLGLFAVASQAGVRLV